MQLFYEGLLFYMLPIMKYVMILYIFYANDLIYSWPLAENVVHHLPITVEHQVYVLILAAFFIVSGLTAAKYNPGIYLAILFYQQGLFFYPNGKKERLGKCLG